MATDFLRWRPLAGLNREDSEDSLGEMEVRNGKNFLWEDDECKTRPGVASEAVSFSPGTPAIGGSTPTSFVYGNSIRVNDLPYTFCIGANDKLYRVDYSAFFTNSDASTTNINSVTPVAVEMTGTAITWGDPIFHNSISFNGIVLIGNSTGGLIRWDPATSYYTIITDAKFRYITAHLSRAVGGYDTNGSVLVGPRTVGYSKVGDETVWTGGFGAGTTLLADSNDEITGMDTLHNVVVVCRRMGFHLGFSTGDSTAPFRFEKWSDNAPGVYFPSTKAVENNVLYFVGRDNTYTFDLNKVEAIGGKIRKDLNAALIVGSTNYRGFISRAAKGSTFRTRYNIVGLGAGLYHYAFDTENGTWSKHLYAFTPGSAWNRIISNTSEGPHLTDTNATTPHFYTWDSALACESAAFILSGTYQFGDMEKDYTVHRVIVRSRDNGAITPTLTLSAILNDAVVTSNVSPTTGTVGADGLWKREWYDVQLVGQEFTIQLDVTGKYSVNLISEKVAEAGGFRG